MSPQLYIVFAVLGAVASVFTIVWLLRSTISDQTAALTAKITAEVSALSSRISDLDKHLAIQTERSNLMWTIVMPEAQTAWRNRKPSGSHDIRDNQ